MPAMATFSTVVSVKLYASTFNAIDRTNVYTVGTNDVHVRSNQTGLKH
jgi:hypothetical protein